MLSSNLDFYESDDSRDFFKDLAQSGQPENEGLTSFEHQSLEAEEAEQAFFTPLFGTERDARYESATSAAHQLAVPL